jgi:hypothetical protein
MALMMTGGERGNTTTRESQELYTTGVETVQDSNDYEAARLPVRFWDKLATPEVLALSRPPTDFPLSVPDTAPQPWEQVREFQRVREENQALQGEVRRRIRPLPFSLHLRRRVAGGLIHRRGIIGRYDEQCGRNSHRSLCVDGRECIRPRCSSHFPPDKRR